ncbi:MAG: MucB/RseB C-terminal domain-containing protein [Betaproteobacteria bacterium]
MKALAFLLCLLPGVALSQAQPQAQQSLDAAGWLKKIYQASQKLSYSGTFVYRQGERSESSRITRVVDGNLDMEKLEALDGVRREIVRRGDEVRCYLPDSKTVKVDLRSKHPSFPALVPAKNALLSDQYTVSKEETARIAGYDCQAIALKPKDDLRYGYKLWADMATGMLLKARILNENGEAVEEFTFTQLSIGGHIDREALKSSFAAQSRQWRVENAGVAPADTGRSGWSVSPAIPGFQKVIELKRLLRPSRRVSQIVYSDGLAAVSVFIEQLEPRQEPVREGLSTMGAVNIYTRQLGDHLVTVVGEAPAKTVRQIADTVQYHRP